MVGSAGSRSAFAGGTLGSFGAPVGQALGDVAGQALGAAFGYPGASGAAPTIEAPPAAPAPAAPAANDPAQMVTKLFGSAGGALNSIAKRFPWWMWFIGGAVLMWFVGKRGLLKKVAGVVG